MIITRYEVSREYGGPEEGGWWWDNYSNPVRYLEARDQYEAIIMARRLNQAEEATREESREPDRFSVAGGADHVYLAEDEFGENETKERPYYC
jgi:hypothetical protein